MVLAWLALACGGGDRSQVERALLGRGRVAVAGGARAWQVELNGTTLVPLASLPTVAQAFAGANPEALVHALADAGVNGVLLDLSEPPSQGVGEQLAHMSHVQGLSGVFFNRAAAFYVLDPVRTWSPALREGLAVVARRLVGGAGQPRISSFPKQARRLDPVEVMVLLRSGDRPRLWRSARGSSFARALLTAAAVARQRWIERAAALGGRLDRALPTLAVEVALLQDDGELGTRSESFVNQAVTAEHGVGFERKGGWHYLLPDATHRGGRTPSEAYRQLFEDNGMPADSLGDSDLRLYRVAVQHIGSSPPTQSATDVPDDGLSEVKSPSEVLGE